MRVRLASVDCVTPLGTPVLCNSAISVRRSAKRANSGVVRGMCRRVVGSGVVSFGVGSRATGCLGAARGGWLIRRRGRFVFWGWVSICIGCVSDVARDRSDDLGRGLGSISCVGCVGGFASNASDRSDDLGRGLGSIVCIGGVASDRSDDLVGR
jgi:hypothetical protein